MTTEQAPSGPWVVQANAHTAALFRLANQSFYAQSGVVSSGDLAVTPLTGTNMYISVAPGQVWIPGSLGSTTGMPYNAATSTYPFTTQGSYFGYNDAAITSLYCAASNPTNPRYDLVVASVADAAYSGSSNNWSISIVTGTAAASPVVPYSNAPNNYIPLASIYIPANSTAVTSGNIVDLRPFWTPQGSQSIWQTPNVIGLSQNGAIAISTSYARYFKFGRFVTITYSLTATGNGASGYPILVYQPTTFSPVLGSVAYDTTVGAFNYITSGGSPRYAGSVILGTFQGSSYYYFETTGASNVFGINPAITVASGDHISMTATYETTS